LRPGVAVPSRARAQNYPTQQNKQRIVRGYSWQLLSVDWLLRHCTSFGMHDHGSFESLKTFGLSSLECKTATPVSDSCSHKETGKTKLTVNLYAVGEDGGVCVIAEM